MSQPIQRKQALKPAEILAIDDDEWFLRLLVKKFEDVDPTLNITQATTAKEALKLLEEKKFDAILCDHKLPGQFIEIRGQRFPADGIHIMRKFKDEMKIETPFIFVTGQGSEEIASQALQLGSAGYFIKRVQPGYYNLMATSIRQFIDRYWLQNELKESELRYRELFENSTGLIFIFDIFGNLHESNQNFYKVFGYNDTKELNVSKLAYSDDIEKWRNMITSVGAGNNEVQLLRSLTKDGKILHLDVNAGPIWGPQKKGILYVQAIARDISDQVQTQQALIDSEEKHRKIIEGSIDGMIFFDMKGTIIDWNPAATFITGIEFESVIGKNINDIVHKLKPSELNEPYVLMEPTSRIDQSYVDTLLGDPESRPSKVIELSLENVVTEKRHILEAVAFIVEHSKGDRLALVLRDVTERHIAEEESRSYAQRFQILIEQTAIGVWITDAETEMTTYVNEAIAQLLGYSAREMIGVPVLDFATPESAKIIKEKTQSRISDGIDHETYELQFFHRSGKIIQARITAAAIRDEHGIVQETYGLIRDITKEREREQELKRTKTFLESIIAAMPSGVYSYDLNTKITMANPKLAKILGYTNENELIGRSVYDLFPKRDHSHIKSLIKERMTGQPSEEFMMITYQTRQGQEVKTTVTSVPLVIGNEVEGSVVSVSDITEQNLVEDYLHKISHEYRTLLEKLDLGIIKVDNLGKIVSYNHEAAELLNFAAFSDLGDFNILEYQPFKEAGLHSEFRDLLYKRTVEKTIVAPLIDEFGKKQELKFQFLPVHDQNMETFAWFLFIEPAN